MCLLQWLFHWWKVKQVKVQTKATETNLAEVGVELTEVRRDHMQSLLENRLLKEFVSQRNVETSITLLLRRFLPNQRDGFCAILQFTENDHSIVRARGLSEKSVQNFQLDAKTCKRLRKKRVFRLEGEELFESPVLAALTDSDRGKLKQLYFVGVEIDNQLSYAFVTTSLYPRGGDFDRQVSLVRQLICNIAVHLDKTNELHLQKNELRVINERLKLRAIGDIYTHSPSAMMSAFLSNFQQMIRSDQVALYVAPEDAQEASIPVYLAGEKLQPGSRTRWEQHMRRVLRMASDHDSPLIQLDRQQLTKLGVGTLMSHVLVVKLRKDNHTIAFLCCTKRNNEEFEHAELRLAEWAGLYLAKSLQRWMDLIHIEKQAKQDAVTKLANRHEFDGRIIQEVQHAKDQRTCCSLVMIDLDHFKMVNDEHGHQAGDLVLKECANVIVELLKQIPRADRALPSRYGGEEFAVLLPGMNEEEATQIAEAVRRSVGSKPIEFNRQQIAVTLSAGVAAACGPSMMEAADLVAAADAALYISKESGRNRVTKATEITLPSKALPEVI
ncbi:MAG: hypothetical protein Tsb009_32160 [Planctomycetaceae bacterium]